jgi:hypothetical protein
LANYFAAAREALTEEQNMKSVWKFPLAMTGIQDVEIPGTARLLSVQPQGDGVCLWALCDTTADKVKRRICIVGTGHEAPEIGSLYYISTFQLHGGALVFHAFEICDATV